MHSYYISKAFSQGVRVIEIKIAKLVIPTKIQTIRISHNIFVISLSLSWDPCGENIKLNNLIEFEGDLFQKSDGSPRLLYLDGYLDLSMFNNFLVNQRIETTQINITIGKIEKLGSITFFTIVICLLLMNYSAESRKNHWLDSAKMAVALRVWPSRQRVNFKLSPTFLPEIIEDKLVFVRSSPSAFVIISPF